MVLVLKTKEDLGLLQDIANKDIQGNGITASELKKECKIRDKTFYRIIKLYEQLNLK
jgi:hypothetical protein